MDPDLYDDEVPVNLKAFHNTTREYVIFLLLFAFLYTTSYCFIGLYQKKFPSYPDCYEDAFANRISLWIGSFSLSVSVGAAFLLPISIISNEVLLLYPNSYYVQWLNSSLIQGLWNHVFLFSNLALFLLLPFSHFILEAEGFPGSKKGIMSRVNEALLVLGLIGLVIVSTIYIISAIFDSGPYLQPVFSLSSYYLPFLYSCVSFIGVLMLLLCTPVGFARLFTVMSDKLMKRKKSDGELNPYSIEDGYHLYLNEDINNGGGDVSTSYISDSNLIQRRIDKFDNRGAPARGPHTLCTHQGIHKLEKLESTGDSPNVHSPDINPKMVSIHHRIDKLENIEEGPDVNIPIDFKKIMANWEEEQEGKFKFSLAALRKNCVYPFVMLVLVFLTALSVLMVSQNTLELCFGVKSLPVYTQNLTLGITSLSVLGPIGAGIEIIMILYLWCTSIVGLYSLPLFCSLRPKPGNTSLSQVIGNCAVLLVLSSALPVLARSLGITNFDLLGDFGRINWLENFYLVLFHNTAFAVSVAMCLCSKITSSVRKEIYERLCCVTWSPFSWMSSIYRYYR